jgi:hypothetical protein
MPNLEQRDLNALPGYLPAILKSIVKRVLTIGHTHTNVYVQMARQAIWNRKGNDWRTPHDELVAGSKIGFVRSEIVPHQETGDVFIREDDGFPGTRMGFFPSPAVPVWRECRKVLRDRRVTTGQEEFR